MMAWAVIHKTCDWRWPGRNVAYTALPRSRPYQLPRLMVDYAVANGFGTEVPGPSKDDAPAGAGVIKRPRKGRKPGR